MKNKTKALSIYAGILIFLMFGVFILSQFTGKTPIKYTHSQIVYMFEDNLVKSYNLNLGTAEIQIKIDMENPKSADVVETALDKDGVKYVTATLPYMSKLMEDIAPYVSAYNIENSMDKMEYDFIPSKDNSWLVTLVPMLLTSALLVGLFFILMRQSGGGGKLNQFSKANTKTIQPGKKTTFAEVAGADEEKEELYEIVEFLKKPERFNTLGARIPKGVLLMGPPGTGKTLLARAVAGEAGVPFYSISGSDFVEMFVGVGASRVRDLFGTAKKNAPSIVFIDEIDAVGRHRGSGMGGGHDEREQTLNQLLVEMDGFGENSGVIIIAATNRRDILDPALLRPGRFDRQVVVGYPDVKGREEILRVHARNKPLGFDVDLKTIAKTTVGFTGADLENLLNEAALLAAKNNRKAIIEEDIESATIKVIAGPEKKSRKVSDTDKEITAYHEAGHAIVSTYCKTQDDVHEISIIQRGMAAGYTMHLPSDDTTHMSRKKMQESLVVLLAGRVAEELCLDDICTGASNDIERATQTARDMVTRYGFSNKLGTINYGQTQGEVFLGRDVNHQKNYSETIATDIDNEIRGIIEDAYQKARAILQDHKDELELVTAYLLEFEKINGVDYKKLLSGTMEFKPKTKEERENKRLEEIKAKTNDVSSDDVSLTDSIDNQAENADNNQE